MLDPVKDYSPAVPYGDVSGLCLDPEDYDERRWLADFRVLSVSVRGDSGKASAAITTVARQRNGGNSWISTLVIEEDTAHWRMVRARETEGQWKVCGGADKGFEFYQEQPAQWLTGSDSAARTAIDSIRRARGLRLAR